MYCYKHRTGLTDTAVEHLIQIAKDLHIEEREPDPCVIADVGSNMSRLAQYNVPVSLPEGYDPHGQKIWCRRLTKSLAYIVEDLFDGHIDSANRNLISVIGELAKRYSDNLCKLAAAPRKDISPNTTIAMSDPDQGVVDKKRIKTATYLIDDLELTSATLSIMVCRMAISIAAVFESLEPGWYDETNTALVLHRKDGVFHFHAYMAIVEYKDKPCSEFLTATRLGD